MKQQRTMQQPHYRKKRPPLLVRKHYAYAKLPEIMCSSFFRPYDPAPRYVPSMQAKAFVDTGYRPYDVTPPQYVSPQRPYDAVNPPNHQSKKLRHLENPSVIIKQADMASRQCDNCYRQTDSYVPTKAAPYQDNGSLMGAGPMTWETTPPKETTPPTGQGGRPQYDSVKSNTYHRWAVLLLPGAHTRARKLACLYM